MIAAFLTALRMKGETVGEITGAVRVMREKVTVIDAGIDMAAGGVVVDTCGTGGSSAAKLFNISTAAALITAAAGVPVAPALPASAMSRRTAAACVPSSRQARKASVSSPIARIVLRGR